MDTREQLLESEANKLIKLVDEYLSRTGQNITSYRFNDAPAASVNTASPYAPRNDVPASLQYYPVRIIADAATWPESLTLHQVVPLREHLDELARERQELAALNAKIRESCADRELYDFTRNLLAEKYQKLKGLPVDAKRFEQTTVAKLLALLRVEEKRAQEPELHTFPLRAITEIDDEGRVRRIQT